MFDLISIGDSTLDVFLEIDEATVLCEVEKEKCRLCVNYADKIPVKKLTKISGVGNAANLAVGSARLGLKTGIYTILGNDETGKEIYQRLTKEGIASDYIQFDKKKGSNFSTVLNFKGERTIFVFHEHRNYKLPKFAKTKWLYFSSLAEGHENLHQPLIDLVVKNKIKLGFNPGTFQLKEGLKILRPIMKVTTVFIVNKEEAQKLAGKIDDIKKLILALKKEGPEIVVVTDGPDGSYVFDGKNFYFQYIFDVPVIERTGCGDSYSTGFICALVYGRDIPEAMRWGTVNAAFVLQKIGGQEGLLKKRKLLKVLKDNPQFQTEKI